MDPTTLLCLPGFSPLAHPMGTRGLGGVLRCSRKHMVVVHLKINTTHVDAKSPIV